MTTEYGIYFYHSKSKANSYGLAPIVCRVVVDRRMVDISTKLFIGTCQWSDNRITGTTPEIITLNASLSQLEERLHTIVAQLEGRQEHITAARIKEVYKASPFKMSRAQYCDGITTYLRTELKTASINPSVLASVKATGKKKLNSKLPFDRISQLVGLRDVLVFEQECFKKFKRFLRENHLKYNTLRSATGPVLTVWMARVKLVFFFDPAYDYVTVGRVTDNGYITKTGEFLRRTYTYSFPAMSTHRILAKLIQYQIVEVDQIKKLKY